MVLDDETLLLLNVTKFINKIQTMSNNFLDQMDKPSITNDMFGARWLILVK